MRIFDLFLRRARIHRASVCHRRYARPRLTVLCAQDALGLLRRQICLAFSAAGLEVCRLQVNQSKDPRLVSACITVNCPPALRAELIAQARLLRAHPAVRAVCIGAPRPVFYPSPRKAVPSAFLQSRQSVGRIHAARFG